MRTSIQTTALAIILAFAAFGAQPVWEKPVGSWTAEDVSALLTNSPWAIQTSAEMDDPRDVIEPRPAGPPDTGNTGMTSAAGKPRWDGEIGRNRMGRLATVPVTVRWDSALPVRQGQKELAAPATAYVISISGLVPAKRFRSVGKTQTSSSSDGSVDARNPEDMLEGFMSSSKIVLKGAGELHPENVKFDPETGVVRVFFARAQPIDSGQKEALFTTRFGALKVKAKFRLSAMKYHGNIEL